MFYYLIRWAALCLLGWATSAWFHHIFQPHINHKSLSPADMKNATRCWSATVRAKHVWKITQNNSAEEKNQRSTSKGTVWKVAIASLLRLEGSEFSKSAASKEATTSLTDVVFLRFCKMPCLKHQTSHTREGEEKKPPNYNHDKVTSIKIKLTQKCNTQRFH